VAGAVDEVRPVAAARDVVPGGGVDVLAGGAHGRRAHGPGLRLVEEGVGLGHVAGDGAGVHAAGDVGAVAVRRRAAEVAEHELAGLDDPVARLVVRAGGVGTGGHDGEVHARVPLGEQPPAELGGDGGLGPPHERDLACLELGGDAVGGCTGAPQRVDLGRVLHRAQGRRHRRRPPPGRGRQPGLELDEELRPRPVPDGHHPGPTGERSGDADRVLRLLPGAHREDGGERLHARRLQPGDDEGGVLVPGDDQHREPLERHRLVPREPREVGAEAQQHHVDALRLHRRPHPGQPLAVHRLGCHHASPARARPGSPSMLVALLAAQ
jgi:hypothetical protein